MKIIVELFHGLLSPVVKRRVACHHAHCTHLQLIHLDEKVVHQGPVKLDLIVMCFPKVLRHELLVFIAHLLPDERRIVKMVLRE